ncbi:MAG: serine protease, partial [Deltaproteobacteria bacterium]|nr:serine protease [Deltaproteobacteria bacterium]
LETWQSPWIDLEWVGDAPTLVPRYVDDHAQPLVRRGDRLVIAASGEEHVLDGRGRPIRAGDTEYGGCLCCAPPRALARRRKEGLCCPSSGASHLRDGGRVLLERDHPLGRCRVCDSVRPRQRDGSRIICVDCGAGAGTGGGGGGDFVQPMPDQPAMPSEHGRAHDETLPKPPTREELEHIAPHIRAAIGANVFLQGRIGDERWSGSGIIIAREGNHLAILTNRHVVESDETRRLCALKALTVTGEQITATTVWRAKRGVDLALVEARVERPDDLGVMPLGAGAVLVGASVFAIGNPLGLAWSYTGGTLSAIRHWTTSDGQSVRILQTDAPIAPGSSGGGLFHSDGHLLGVMSFLRQGHAGGSAHFALSIDAIRDALTREDVAWRGHQLAALPRQDPAV